MIQAFKYRAIGKYVIDSLIKSQLYFCSPKRLNDPFDCQINIEKALEKSISKSGKDKREKLLKLVTELGDFPAQYQRDSQNFGVFSFSKTALNPVMWSHYADEHRGICLYYEIPNSFLDYSKNGVLGVSPVEYGTNPFSDWFESEALTLSERGLDELAMEMMKKLLIFKNKSWEYEQEARILADKSGNIEIDPGWLKAVFLGMRTPNEDIDLFRRLIRERSSYRDVVFSMVKPDDSDFGVATHEI